MKYNEGNNKLGDMSCKYLSKSIWPVLKSMNLSNGDIDEDLNLIRDEGIQHLVKVQWYSL